MFDHVGLSKCAAVERIAGKVSGAGFKARACRGGDCLDLEDGATVDDFLEWFPAWPANKSRPCWNTLDKAWRRVIRAHEILFDHGTPAPLRTRLAGMKFHAYEMAGKIEQRRLLAAAEKSRRFDHYGPEPALPANSCRQTVRFSFATTSWPEFKNTQPRLLTL